MSDDKSKRSGWEVADKVARDRRGNAPGGTMKTSLTVAAAAALALSALLAGCSSTANATGGSSKTDAAVAPSQTPEAPKVDCAGYAPKSPGTVTAIDPASVEIPGGVKLSGLPDCAFAMDHPNDVYDSVQALWLNVDASWPAQTLPLFKAAGYTSGSDFGQYGGSLTDSTGQLTVGLVLASPDVAGGKLVGQIGYAHVWPKG